VFGDNLENDIIGSWGWLVSDRS